MRGIEIFQKPSYREIRPMRGPPVCASMQFLNLGSVFRILEEFEGV